MSLRNVVWGGGGGGDFPPKGPEKNTGEQHTADFVMAHKPCIIMST